MLVSTGDQKEQGIYDKWWLDTKPAHSLSQQDQMEQLFEASIDEQVRHTRHLIFLRGVRPLYAATEARLSALREEALVKPFYDERDFRDAAIGKDLEDKRETPVPKMQRYVERIHKLKPHELVAYAFTIHMANYAGGQRIAKKAQQYEGLKDMPELYHFPDVEDCSQHWKSYGERLNSQLGPKLDEKQWKEFMKGSVQAFMDIDYVIRFAMDQAE